MCKCMYVQYKTVQYNTKQYIQNSICARTVHVVCYLYICRDTQIRYCGFGFGYSLCAVQCSAVQSGAAL